MWWLLGVGGGTVVEVLARSADSSENRPREHSVFFCCRMRWCISVHWFFLLWFLVICGSRSRVWWLLSVGGSVVVEELARPADAACGGFYGGLRRCAVGFEVIIRHVSLRFFMWWLSLGFVDSFVWWV